VIYTTVSAEAAKTTPASRAAKTKTQMIRLFITQSPFRNGGKYTSLCSIRLRTFDDFKNAPPHGLYLSYTMSLGFW
jgi:hypothetical protein